MKDSSSDEFSLPASSTEEMSIDSAQNSSVPEFVEVRLYAAVAPPSKRFTMPQNTHPDISSIGAYITK